MALRHLAGLPTAEPPPRPRGDRLRVASGCRGLGSTGRPSSTTGTRPCRSSSWRWPIFVASCGMAHRAGPGCWPASRRGGRAGTASPLGLQGATLLVRGRRAGNPRGLAGLCRQPGAAGRHAEVAGIAVVVMVATVFVVWQLDPPRSTRSRGPGRSPPTPHRIGVAAAVRDHRAVPGPARPARRASSASLPGLQAEAVALRWRSRWAWSPGWSSGLASRAASSPGPSWPLSPGPSCSTRTSRPCRSHRPSSTPTRGSCRPICTRSSSLSTRTRRSRRRGSRLMPAPSWALPCSSPSSCVA